MITAVPVGVMYTRDLRPRMAIDVIHMVLSGPADAAGVRKAVRDARLGRIDAAKEDVA